MTEDDLQAIEAQLASDGYGTMCKACTDRLRQCVGEVRRLRAILEGSETAMEQLGLSEAAKLFSDMREGADKKWQLP